MMMPRMSRMSRMLGKVFAFVQDNPGKVNLLLFAGVALHILLDLFVPRFPHIWYGLESTQADQQADIYLAVLNVSALTAGFAGVVVVFGLSTQPSAFRSLRIKAGASLERNWMSVSNSGFVSAGLALGAVLTLYSSLNWVSVWFFELSILVCLNGIARLLWLLRSLITIVHNDDIRVQQDEDEIK